LGPDVILFDEELYWFNRDLDYKYDVEDFNTLIALARSSEQPSLKINNYIAALRTYKGAFLLDAEGTWIWNERERLRELYIQAALELSGLYFDGGDLTAALEYCQYALDEEPCFEEAHRLAMRVYAARGNRAGINRQFERCKMILKDQVNAAPSPQTVMLYEALIQ
jgi:two-component SAPR family response regulator